MKNLLFLDDEKYRHDGAYLGEANVYHAWTVDEFIRQLYRFGPFDIFSLDHDLREEHYTGDAHTDCGCRAAEIISLLAKKPELVIVHSYNSTAGREMVKKLEDAGLSAVWKPFHPKNTPTKELDVATLLR